MSDTIREEAARWRQLMVEQHEFQQEALVHFESIGQLYLRAARSKCSAMEYEAIVNAHRSAGNEAAEAAATTQLQICKETIVKTLSELNLIYLNLVRSLFGLEGPGESDHRPARIIEDYRDLLDVLRVAGVDWQGRK